MAEVNLPGNSDRQAKQEHTPPREKKVESVTKATLRPPKKSSMLKDAFIKEDAASVANYVLFDIIIPNVSSLVLDAINGGLDRMFNGGGRFSTQNGRSYGRNDRDNGPRTNYSRISTSGRSSRVGTPGGASRTETRRARATHDFRDVIIETRGEAERTLDILQELIDTYNQATVSDLYDIVEITADFTDDKWGWTSIDHASVERVREGFILNLPKPINLDL